MTIELTAIMDSLESACEDDGTVLVRSKTLLSLIAAARRGLTQDEAEAHKLPMPTWLPRVGDMVRMLDMPEAPPVRVVELRDGWRCLLDDGSECRRDCHVSNLGLVEDRRGLEQRWVPVEEGDLVRELTECMRVADQKFERVGGSTRHHVRDCLIPEMEKAGLVIVRALPSPPEAK